MLFCRREMSCMLCLITFTGYAKSYASSVICGVNQYCRQAILFHIDYLKIFTAVILTSDISNTQVSIN